MGWEGWGESATHGSDPVFARSDRNIPLRAYCVSRSPEARKPTRSALPTGGLPCRCLA